MSSSRKPFVVPTVTDQGELSDVTRMFSGGNNGKHKGWNKGKAKGKGHKYGMIDIPGLDPRDLDVEVEDV